MQRNACLAENDTYGLPLVMCIPRLIRVLKYQHVQSTAAINSMKHAGVFWYRDPKKRVWRETWKKHLSRYDPISFSNGFKYSTANSKPTIGGYTGYMEDIGILASKTWWTLLSKGPFFYPRIFPRTTADHVVSNMDKGVSAADQVMFPWVTFRDGVVEEKLALQILLPIWHVVHFWYTLGQQRTPVHFVS